jgi:tRNA 2-(methylsulfanyl)-N6-isopentenyladenosine37 hydroxylase
MSSVFEELREFIPLKSETPQEWVPIALSDFDAFMVDHAFCERKASSTALSLVMNHPEKLDFCEAMIQLALEELEHFHQVFRLMKSRGLQLKGDGRDPYVNALLQHCRNDKEGHFLDRLLIFAIIEARGCERFALIAQHHQDPAMASFYDDLSRAEARHFGLFIRYAKQYCGAEKTQQRLSEFVDYEQKIVESLPWRASLH